MVLVPHLDQTDRVRTRSRHLAPGAYDQEDRHDRHEGDVRREYVFLLLAAAIPFPMPPLPILPRCVHAGVSRLLPPTPIRCAMTGLGLALDTPPKAVEVIHSLLLWVAQDLVSGDDKAVPLELRAMWNSVGGGMVSTIGVV